MARICCVTRSAIYQGALELKTTTGHQMRLLDALNTPQRLHKPASTGDETTLVLEGGVRKVHMDGRVEPFGDVVLRIGAVLAAYELALDAEAEERRAATMKDATLYEQRTLRVQSDAIHLYLSNGWRVKGHLTQGRQALAASNPSRPFVPVLDVRIDEAADRTPKTLPFLAVNLLQLEALGSA